MTGTSIATSQQFGIGDQTDVFAVINGQLTVFWVNGADPWHSPMGLGPVRAFPQGAAVAASQQFGIGDQTDVFAIDNNGQLNVFWVNGAGPWHGPMGLGPVRAFPQGAAVAASQQFGIGDQTDVFAIDNNGRLNVFWVNGAGVWQGPVMIEPVHISLKAIQNSQGRFIEVDGDSFTPNGVVALHYDFFLEGGPEPHHISDQNAVADGNGGLSALIRVNLPEISPASNVRAVDTASNRSAIADLTA